MILKAKYSHLLSKTACTFFLIVMQYQETIRGPTVKAIFLRTKQNFILQIFSRIPYHFINPSCL